VGVLLKRCTYGANLKDAKQQIVAAIARYNEIMRKGAKHSINMSAVGNARILIVTREGASRRKEKEFIDEAVFRELVEAKSFEIEIDATPPDKSEVRILFWYNQENHMGNSVGVEFISEFFEGLNFAVMGLLASLNVIKASAIRMKTETLLNRMQSLWEDVFRSYVGDAMNKTERIVNLRKYELDSILVNVFGNMIKLRRD
jgi:hypothetical protein